jgi:hypothetical protein
MASSDIQPFCLGLHGFHLLVRSEDGGVTKGQKRPMGADKVIIHPRIIIIAFDLLLLIQKPGKKKDHVPTQLIRDNIFRQNLLDRTHRP